MEILHDTFSFESFIYCTCKSQVVSRVYRHSLNKYIFSGYKIFINFWICDVIGPHM